MNSKRKTVGAAALGIVALGLATGWSVLAAEAWPPKPYKVYSMVGLWTMAGAKTIVKIGPEDQFGAGLCEVIHLTFDPTLGGTVPAGSYITPGYFKYVRTGPDAWQLKGIFYDMQDTKPEATIVGGCVIDATTKMTAPGELEWTMTQKYYWASDDKDLDGLPDEGQTPWNVVAVPKLVWKAL